MNLFSPIIMFKIACKSVKPEQGGHLPRNDSNPTQTNSSPSSNKRKLRESASDSSSSSQSEIEIEIADESNFSLQEPQVNRVDSSSSSSKSIPSVIFAGSDPDLVHNRVSPINVSEDILRTESAQNSAANYKFPPKNILFNFFANIEKSIHLALLNTTKKPETIEIANLIANLQECNEVVYKFYNQKNQLVQEDRQFLGQDIMLSCLLCQIINFSNEESNSKFANVQALIIHYILHNDRKMSFRRDLL